MPLGEVAPGMDCIGLSVVRGTTISQFDVEIIDVIAGETGLGGPRILVRVSGPAVDASGIAQGFSGSPILCRDGAGVRRNAGAISMSVGEYGNHVVLATPIEEMLGDPPADPPGAARAGSLLRSAKPLAVPLTLTGVSGRTRRLVERAAQGAGRAVLAGPLGPLRGFPRQELVPGASVAAMFASGDIGLGGVGTVAYRDGARIWAFGHPFDSLGRRSLFMEDAYVFGVIANPLGLTDFGADSYKLASAGGHAQGAFTSDTLSSVAGTLGQAVPAIPLHVVARDRVAGGRVVSIDSSLADERGLGYGAGMSFLAPIAASQALDGAMRDIGPVTLTMCFRLRIAGRPGPLGFCNPYFDNFAPLDDIGQAAALVDGFDIPPPAIEGASISIRARHGVRRDVLLSARTRRTVRPGQRIRVRLTVGRRGDGRRRLSFKLRVPRDLRPGPRTLVLTGSGGSDSFEDELLFALEEALGGELGGGEEPHTIGQLERRLEALRRDLGIEARFRRGEDRLVVRSDDVSYEGRVRVSLDVRRARR
jgi:hypothetical protein